jgi:hypothetical protein
MLIKVVRRFMVSLHLPMSKRDWSANSPAKRMLLLGCVPAVGIAAAFYWWGFGTPRWQLAVQLHHFAV